MIWYIEFSKSQWESITEIMSLPDTSRGICLTTVALIVSRNALIKMTAVKMILKWHVKLTFAQWEILILTQRGNSESDLEKVPKVKFMINDPEDNNASTSKQHVTRLWSSSFTAVGRVHSSGNKNRLLAHRCAFRTTATPLCQLATVDFKPNKEKKFRVNVSQEWKEEV